MSTYVLLCYVALSVPVIVAGEAADRFGLRVVTAWYVAGLAIVVGSALVLSRRR
jgi:MFS family permease